MIAHKLVDGLDVLTVETRDIGQSCTDFALMDNRLDAGNFLWNGKLAFLIEKNDFVEWRLFVSLDQDAVTLFQCMGDGTFFKGVVGHYGKVPGIINSDNARAGLGGPSRVLAHPVYLKAVRIVFVIAYTDFLCSKPLDQMLQQGGLAHPREPGKTEERGFELFPVNVHKQNLSQYKGPNRNALVRHL